MRAACIAVSLLVCGVAAAQPSDSTALAEQLFNEGRAFAKANNWTAACPKFEQSLRYDPALGTRLNLATCYEKTGRLASAWGQYREAADLAARTGDTARRDFAQKSASALEPRLPRLTIVAPKTVPPGLVVQRDGAALDTTLLGSALFVDPGAHEVTASAPDFKAVTTKVTLAEGKAETVQIAELVPAPGEPAHPAKPPQSEDKQPTQPPPPAQPQVDAPPPMTRKYIALGVAGGGVVLAGIGFVFGAKAGSTYDKAKQLCGDDLVCDGTDDFTKGKQLIRDARSQATISTILVIAGGAAVAGGAVLWFTAPERRVVPVVGTDHAGVAVQGRF